MAIDRPHLLVGPVAYRQGDTGVHPTRRVQTCKWEFIGFTASGAVRRWNLMYSVEGRKFTVNALAVSQWEQAHAADLRARFQAIAVLRSMLPKGSMLVALKAMIPDTDLAEVVAISLRGGELDRHSS